MDRHDAMKGLPTRGVGPLRLGPAERFALRVALLFGVFGVSWIFLSDHLVHRGALAAFDTGTLQTAKGLLFVGLSAALIFSVTRQGYRALALVAQRLADVQRMAHTGDWSFDSAADEVRWSEELYRIFGLDPRAGPVSTGTYMEAIHPDDRAEVMAAGRRALTEGGSYEFQHRIIRRDGGVRHMHARAEAWRKPDGSIGGLYGTAHDITERQAASHGLQRRVVVEAGLARISSLLGSGTADSLDQVLGVIGPLVDVDQAAIHLRDNDGATIAAAHVWRPPDGEPVLERGRAIPVERLPWLLEQIAAGREVRSDDVSELPDSAARERSFFVAHGIRSAVALPLGGREGDLGFLGLHCHQPRRWTDTDLELLRMVSRMMATELERRRVEERMRFLSRAVEQSPVSIMITDLAGDIIYVNPKFASVTGYAIAEVLGRNPRMLQSGSHDDAFYADLWQTITAGREWRGEIRNRRKDGELFWEVVAISPVVGPDGQIAHFVAVKEDVTERRTLQKKLEEAQKMEAVGRLAGGIAHDFNNVLTAIGGHARLLLDQVGPADPLRDDVEEIVMASDRAGGVIRQLLLFSRQASSTRTVVELKGAVDDMRRMLERLLGEDVRLEVEACEEACPVRADRSQVDQVLMNLVINARDAMPHGGTLRIALDRVELGRGDVDELDPLRPGPHVRLTVTDTGTGMDDHVKDHLFEPFFTTKPPGKGTGLGLATVYGMVQEHEGHIGIRSEAGAGSAFTLHFPLSKVEAADARTGGGRTDGAKKASGVASRGEPRGAGSGEVVLVAEDEAAVRALVRKVLVRLGYEVLEACDGAEAEHVASTFPGVIGLLLTDTVMPGMRGPELARRIRARRPDVPVLFMSGYTFDDSADEAMAPDAAFLAKPFTPAALVRAVRSAMVRGDTGTVPAGS